MKIVNFGFYRAIFLQIKSDLEKTISIHVLSVMKIHPNKVLAIYFSVYETCYQFQRQLRYKAKCDKQNGLSGQMV